MKLLFDHNLSSRLCSALRDLWPDTTHTKNVSLERADDSVVWEFARANGYIIVTKDSDFTALSFVLGAPPKVVSIQLGNCSTRDVELTMRARGRELNSFATDPKSALLVIGPLSGD